jgi:hypothetical protein
MVRMGFRKLRIAWSITLAAAALLLALLWVRSYWRLEILEKVTGSQAIQVSSVKGRIAIAILDSRIAIGRSYLNVVSGDAAEWRKRGPLGFAYYRDGSLTAVVAPHWLPAFLCAALALIPWFSRCWRFSVRTLLIAMTLVVVALGLIIWAASWA